MAGRAATTVTEAGLQRIVQQIVEHCRPDKVILFGSHAYGTPTEDSDVDLLVVMETAERPLRTAARIAASIDHPFPLDIIVRTPDDIALRAQAGDSFITDVTTKGVVLYEAGNGGLDQES
jgi:uncharacterized protein